jgi:hypothetical protein
LTRTLWPKNEKPIASKNKPQKLSEEHCPPTSSQNSKVAIPKLEKGRKSKAALV